MPLESVVPSPMRSEEEVWLTLACCCAHASPRRADAKPIFLVCLRTLSRPWVTAPPIVITGLKLASGFHSSEQPGQQDVVCSPFIEAAAICIRKAISGSTQGSFRHLLCLSWRQLLASEAYLSICIPTDARCTISSEGCVERELSP